MRASFWVLGPLLARAHEAQVSLPGGCAIGTRPVDLYLKGLEAMGAEIEVEGGYVNASAKGGLKGARIDLPFVSVGATHVLMMAASLATGTTLITNAATEPEVVDVGTCLMAMGAKIEGLGTRNLFITGVDKLSRADHTVSRDRIEAGAFALAIAATRGDASLTGIQENVLGALAPAMRLAGCQLQEEAGAVRIIGPQARPIATPVTTEPYPGFATDLQAPFMGLMCGADGVSRIRETIFENRFMHVQELARLGADITLEGDTAIVTGVEQLQGAPVMATDLRASATLVIAGLMAKGQTRISRVYHLDRGYERIEEKLSGAGANIWRENV
jgi:UDP-N-acetylglucosamine 1-carboxyvinyltransferase